jgi:tetratricopeptide (TPR) repeat protein
LADAFCRSSGYLSGIGQAKRIPLHGRYGLQRPSLRFALHGRTDRALAIVLTFPLGGCSFDLGSWGSDKAKPQAVEQNRPARSAHQSAATPKATRRAARRSPNPARPKRHWPNSTARSRSIPYNVQALYGRGLIYQADKQHEQAIADFTAANGLTPQRIEPLLARATSYLAVDKTKEAASDLDEAVQADPNSAQAWSARGVTYERLGDKAKAFTVLRPRARAPPQGRSRAKRPRAHRRLALLYYAFSLREPETTSLENAMD